MQPITCILLLLHITNMMFNQITWDACRLLLPSIPELKHMDPHFNQICKELNWYWWETDNGTNQHFQQHMRRIHTRMPCKRKLCWHCIFPTIEKDKLRTYLKISSEFMVLLQVQQNPNFTIPPSHTSSFIKNTELLLPLQDIECLCIKRIDTLGKPIVVKLNQWKTQLLTSP